MGGTLNILICFVGHLKKLFQNEQMRAEKARDPLLRQANRRVQTPLKYLPKEKSNAWIPDYLIYLPFSTIIIYSIRVTQSIWAYVEYHTGWSDDLYIGHKIDFQPHMLNRSKLKRKYDRRDVKQRRQLYSNIRCCFGFWLLRYKSC